MLRIVCSLEVSTRPSAIGRWHVHRVQSLRAAVGAFGRRLREVRTGQGLSQEALADLAGIHSTYVGSVERGERNIALDNIPALADALGVLPARLTEPKRPEDARSVICRSCAGRNQVVGWQDPVRAAYDRVLSDEAPR